MYDEHGAYLNKVTGKYAHGADSEDGTQGNIADLKFTASYKGSTFIFILVKQDGSIAYVGLHDVMTTGEMIISYHSLWDSMRHICTCC
jgi:hypothetical protein